MTLPAGWNASPQAQDPADDVLPGAGELPGPHAQSDATPAGGGRGVGNTEVNITAAGGSFNAALQSALDASMAYRDSQQNAMFGSVNLGGYTAANESVIERD
jgi:hypothetical protein